MDYNDAEEHKNNILTRFAEDFAKKYDTGQIEHGGLLFNKNVQDMAKEEVLDFVSYLYTLIDQVQEATNFLDAELSLFKHTMPSKNVASAYNILKYGNIRGKVEEEL